jgi:S-DNA-T family DNA segregation ATPase FtsK/SpoIIIE
MSDAHRRDAAYRGGIRRGPTARRTRHKAPRGGLRSPTPRQASGARDLRETERDIRRTQDPGSVGLVGTYERTAALGRAMLLLAAAHHGADDLVIDGFLSESRSGDWAWLKWLPHVRPERATDAAETLLSWRPSRAEQRGRWVLHELANRRRLLDETNRRSGDQPPTFPWLLLFVDDLGAARSEPAFQLALAGGSRLNVSIIGLADSLVSLPQRMGGMAAFEDPSEKLLSYTDVGAEFEPVECDADRLSLFEALDLPTIEHLDMDAAWTVPDLAHLLRLPLGLSSGESLLELDLKEQGLGGHGPHGLFAGTTGAGKSELLQTIIAGLALAHPPDVLNFVLIDYKGGDAFSSVVDLPHTLALMTDLDEHLTDRSLVF